MPTLPFPRHFFMAFNMKPNGNMDYATKLEERTAGTQRVRKQPRPLALASPRTEKQPNNPLKECHHEGCTNKDSGGYIIASRKGIRHGDMCNGDIPLWECHLTIRLLSPGLLMNDLSKKCRSVILASGSLAPLQSLCAELNLYGPKQESSSTAKPGEFPLSQLSSDLGAKSNSINLLTPSSQDTPIPKYPATSTPSPATTKQNNKELSGRLQVKPKPLEAGHVIDLKKQLLACAIGHFPDGTPLTVSYANYKEDSFFPRLGHALASVIENIPFGGVLVFLPSYSFLNKCIKCWNPATFGEPGSNKTTMRCPEIWNRFLQAKGKVIVEPTGSQEKFDAARLDYQDQIRREKRCLLLAVFRGKMSEGISFNDDNARAVICIGIPYPNSFDRNIRAKKAYNDEQRKFCNNTNLLPGQEWYSQQAYRAIAQALGRCIRHGADYGAVILMDSRQCDDGSPNGGIPTPHRNLPVWMRHTVRTLSMRPHCDTSGGTGGGVGVVDPILGGYKGLAQEFQRFFVQAPVHSQAVLDKWKLDLETAQNQCRDNEGGRTFDGVTGQWQDVSIPASSSACVGSAIGSSVVKTEL
jgi:Fanconi anemia group J protein